MQCINEPKYHMEPLKNVFFLEFLYQLNIKFNLD
jgi:hypothetical protein